MTRIIIEVDESGAVATGAEPASPAASSQSAPAAIGAPASDPFAGAINAGGAPEIGSDNAPHLFIGSSAPPPGVSAHEAVSAGAAPAHLFEMSAGGVA